MGEVDTVMSEETLASTSRLVGKPGRSEDSCIGPIVHAYAVERLRFLMTGAGRLSKRGKFIVRPGPSQVGEGLAV